MIVNAVPTVFSAARGKFDAASCQKTANAVPARAAVDIRPLVAHRIERRLIRPSDAGPDLIEHSLPHRGVHGGRVRDHAIHTNAR
jgi:hypothetical protein